VLRPKSRSIQFQACLAPYVLRFHRRRESRREGSRRQCLRSCFAALELDNEFNIDAGIHRGAKVIHAADVDYENVLRVEPVVRPGGCESKPVTAVLKAVIIEIALVHTKRVFASKVGLVAVVRNASVVALGALPLLFVLRCRPFLLWFLLLLCVLLILLRRPFLLWFLLLLRVLLILLRVLLILLRRLFLLRLFLLRLCAFLLLLGGLILLHLFIFLLGVFVRLCAFFLLAVNGSRRSQGQRQNCRTDNSY